MHLHGHTLAVVEILKLNQQICHRRMELEVSGTAWVLELLEKTSLVDLAVGRQKRFEEGANLVNHGSVDALVVEQAVAVWLGQVTKLLEVEAQLLNHALLVARHLQFHYFVHLQIEILLKVSDTGFEKSEVLAACQDVEAGGVSLCSSGRRRHLFLLDVAL